MKALREVDRGFPGTVSTLQELIRQPSVSAKNEGIEECALLVHRILKKSGIAPEILRIKGAAPLVYGEVRSRANPGRTLLFYNHYDVQPAEPIEPWDHPPFGGTVRGNKIFGRGATDDKGELVTRIKAVEACLRAEGDVPCNVKFVIEGEEETGSEHIGAYLKKYRKKFACDGVIWEFGYVDSSDRPVISLGMKGLLYVELSVIVANQDAHSSLAVLIENPAWRLVCALNTMRGSTGKVLIKDWYQEVKPLGKKDARLVSREPFDEAAFRREFGIDGFVGGIRGTAAKKALVSGATCNIAGFHTGYGGEGAKTVLPAKAVAKVDFRLVPGMDPKKQEARLRRHLLSHGFGDISVKVFHGEAAARTDPGHKLVSDTVAAADESYGSSVLSVSNAGTGPMHQFSILNAPCVAIGSTHVFSRIHSANEYARTDLLKKTTKCICILLDRFAQD